MSRRPGMTMTEVLVAIFIVAIGLAGIMSMVPFGAKQMSDALTADRATTHATSTEGTVRSYWRNNIVENGPPTGEPFWDALDNPEGVTLPAPPNPLGPRGLPIPLPNEPSYPVFLDPIGVVGRTGNGVRWVGDGGATNVPRRSMRSVDSSGDPARLALRMWSQADGFTWDEVDGATPKPGAEMRELRYNSLAVIQRPTDRERYTATLKVVVFSNRRFAFNPPGSEAVLTNVALTPGRTDLRLQVSALPANVEIKKGSWIMDATVNPAEAPALRHANFYRVVSATEDETTPGTFDVELATPIRRIDGGSGVINRGTIVVMPGVAAVFEFPALTGSTGP